MGILKASLAIDPSADVADMDGTYDGLVWRGPGDKPARETFDAELARQQTPRLETSKLRFALELRARGLWPTVKAAIASSEEASLYWELADVVASDNALLLSMAAGLGMTEVQVREIITAAIARKV